MHVDVIDDFGVLTRLKDNWDAVYDSDPEAQVFLSWPWIANWFRKLDCPWVILAAKPSAASSSYAAFFPLQLQTKQTGDGEFYNEFEMGGAPLAGYTGLLCVPEFQNGAIPAFAAAVRKFCWTNLKLEKAHLSAERLRLFLASFGDADFSPAESFIRVPGDDTDYGLYPYIDLPGDWETYLDEHLGSATRSNARSHLRRLESGEFRVAHASEETLDRDLGTLMGLWEDKWAPLKGEAGARRESNNHRNMLSACFKDGIVLLATLWDGERPIGAQGTLIDRRNKSLVCLIGSRDLAVKKPSPSFILHLHSIRWAIENGFATYDLQLGNHRYKYDFGPKERRIGSVWIGTKTKRNLHEKLEPRSHPAVLAQAARLLQSGKAIEAAIGLRQILHADPGNAGAKRLLSQAVASRWNTLPQDFAKAFERHQQNQWIDASALYRAVLAIDPQHFDAAHLLGVAYFQQGLFERAERQIDRAIGINPRVASAYSNRGNALRALNRPDDALTSYAIAIVLKPDYPDAYNNQGTVLHDLKRLDDALASFEKALSLNPDYALARSNRAKVLHDMGRDG